MGGSETSARPASVASNPKPGQSTTRISGLGSTDARPATKTDSHITTIRKKKWGWRAVVPLPGVAKLTKSKPSEAKAVESRRDAEKAAEQKTKTSFDREAMEQLLADYSVTEKELTYPLCLILTDEKYKLTSIGALSEDKLIKNNVLMELDITGAEDHSGNSVESLDSLARFTALQIVRASYNRLRSITIHSSHLVDLFLNNNELTLIPDLKTCHKLKRLHLEHNRIQLPSVLSEDSKLVQRDDSWNQLAALKHLVELRLAHNRLDFDLVKYENVPMDDENKGLSCFYRAAEVFKDKKALTLVTLDGNPLTETCKGYMQVVMYYLPRDAIIETGGADKPVWSKNLLSKDHEINIKKIIELQKSTRPCDKVEAKEVPRISNHKAADLSSSNRRGGPVMMRELRRPISTECLGSHPAHTLREPRMLSCLHSFCTVCLAGLVGPNEERIICPECGESTALTKNGLTGVKLLPEHIVAKNKVLAMKVESGGIAALPGTAGQRCENCDDGAPSTFCKTCKKAFCERCIRTTHVGNVFAEHKKISIAERLKELAAVSGAGRNTNGSDNPKCNAHRGEDVTFFCLDCKKLLCRDCLLVESHKGHIIRPLDESSQLVLEELRDQMTRLNDSRCEPRVTSEAIDQRLLTIQASFDQAVLAMELRMVDIRAALRKRQDELVKQMAQIKNEKIAKLKDQQGTVDSALYKINHTAEVIDAVLREANEHELLQMYSVFEDRMRKLTMKMNKEDPVADVKFAVDLEDDAALKLAVSTFGRVL